MPRENPFFCDVHLLLCAVQVCMIAVAARIEILIVGLYPSKG